MTSRAYQHFAAVADEGSFGRAAARLGVAQPALSQSIQRLERRLGVTLLERTGHGVRLTRAGEAFLPDARVAIAAAERAMKLAAAAAAPDRKLRLGVITPALWTALGDAVRIADGLGIRLQLAEGTTPELVHQLENGDLDVSFLAPRLEAPQRMVRLPVSQDAVVAAVPEAIGRLDTFQLMEYCAERLILPPRSYGPDFYDEVLALFAASGLRVTVVQESPRMLTTLALVAAGVGASVVVGPMAGMVSVKGVAYRDFPAGSHPPRWTVALAHMPLVAHSVAAEFMAHWRREVASCVPQPVRRCGAAEGLVSECEPG